MYKLIFNSTHLIPVVLRALVPRVISGVSMSTLTPATGRGVMLFSMVRWGTRPAPGVDVFVGGALVIGLGVAVEWMGGVVESGHAWG